ncbi:Metal cation transporter, ZIP subfamily protein [Balamuthia mandrillaris]
MNLSLLLTVFTAGLAPFLSALLPRFLYRRGFARWSHLLLALSAGLLFAIATVDLIPEALNISSELALSSHATSLPSSNQATTNDNDNNDVFYGYNNEATFYHRPRQLTDSPQQLLSSTPRQAMPHNHRDHDESGGEGEGARYAMIGVGVGYLTLLILEQVLSAYGHAHSHGGGMPDHHIQINDLDLGREVSEVDEHQVANNNNHHSHHNHGGYHNHHTTRLSEEFSFVALLGLTVHSFVDGFVMAGAFEASQAIGFRVAWALILHKIPDGFVMSTILANAPGRSSQTFYTNLLVLCSMTPLGAFLGMLLLGGIAPSFLGFVLGFGAGTFVFITATGIIPELMAKEVNSHSRRVSLACMVASYVLFLIIDNLFHAH